MTQTFVFTDESLIEIRGESTLHPIEGRARSVAGEVRGEVDGGCITLDPAPSGWVEVPVASLTSGKRLQDIKMRRRIGAGEHPKIRYELGEVRGGPEWFTLTGRLTFRGTTREVVEEGEVRLDGDRLTVEAEHVFDIRDFGMDPPRILVLQVEPEVRVRVRLVAVRR